jgi:hypothetical protein
MKTPKEKEEVKPGDPRKLADLELHLCGPQAHFFASSQLGEVQALLIAILSTMA